MLFWRTINFECASREMRRHNIRLNNKSGFPFLLAVLVIPGLLTAYLSHSVFWALAVPVAELGVILILAALPFKRRITTEDFANELERHLLGTGADWEWDRQVA